MQWAQKVWKIQTLKSSPIFQKQMLKIEIDNIFLPSIFISHFFDPPTHRNDPSYTKYGYEKPFVCLDIFIKIHTDQQIGRSDTKLQWNELPIRPSCFFIQKIHKTIVF